MLDQTMERVLIILRRKNESSRNNPAKIPSNIANKNGINTLNDFLNFKTAKLLEKKYGKFDFITSHNVWPI